MSTVVVVVAVSLAGGVGSVLRYLCDRAVSARVADGFPWGTMIVNLTGSFALGLVTGMALSHPWSTIIAVGLLGGYTTFSTASLDSVRLLSERRYAAAALNGPGMLIACSALSVAGILITAR